MIVQRLLVVTVLMVFSSLTSVPAFAQSPDLIKLFRHYQMADKKRDYKTALVYAKKTLELGRRELGDVHKHITSFLTNISLLYKKTGHYKTALIYAKQAFEVDKKLYGTQSVKGSSSLIRLASLYFSMGNYQKALSLYHTALSNNEAALGVGHAQNSTVLNNLGHVYRTIGQHKKAEQFLKRALAIDLKTYGEKHRKTAIDRSNLAGLYKVLGRLNEAGEQYRRALATFESVKGLEDIETGIMADNLGTLYLKMQQYKKAESLFIRAYKIFRKAEKGEGRHSGISLNNIGAASFYNKNYKQAAKYYAKALVITRKYYGDNHMSTANNMDNLAGAYQHLKQYDKALALRLAALKILRAKMGETHDDTATTLNNLGDLLVDMKRYSEAETYYQSAIKVWKTLYGTDHPSTITGLSGLGSYYWHRKQFVPAIKLYRTASAGLGRYASRNLGKVGKAYSPSVITLIGKNDFVFEDHVAVAYRLAKQKPAQAEALKDEAFQIAQWALQTEASDALGKMAARFSTNNEALANLIKKRQDAVTRWERLRKAVSAALLSTRGKRNLKREEAIREKIQSLQQDIQKLDNQLAQDYPQYATLTNPKPLSITQVQQHLKPSEGLVQFLFTRSEGYAWLITPSASQWFKIPHGRAYIFLKVFALRCGLDAELWSRKPAREACLKQLGKVVPADKLWQAQQVLESDGRLPFDLTTAHKLYNDLFSGFGEELKQVKHLMILPTGALSSLPFQVLVRSPVATYLANDANYDRINWMVRGHALSVLPSVASLTALRSLQKRKAAQEPYIGYGNPVLEGKPPACPVIDVPEQCAVTYLSADGTRGSQKKVHKENKKGKKYLLASLEKSSGLDSLFRSSRTDVNSLRQQCPLPDTAYELNCVAQTLGVDRQNIYLQQQVTETEVKKASQSGKLKNYRILHFATHGLLGWQTSSMKKGLAEPALLMTPPAQATELDDGLLSASEIAKLDLNADWVILSACNTAMGNGKRFSGLSGLAKSFLYAGSRALLVSHWSVYSDAAVELTTYALNLQKQRPETGRAEAMRRSMMALMANKNHYMAGHPAVWAPFIVLGEGG